MCRLLGIIADGTADFSEPLGKLALKSPEHPDGWGLAFFSQERQPRVRKSTRQASLDRLFKKESEKAAGNLLMAHIRKATQRELCLENTHPFGRGLSWPAIAWLNRRIGKI